MRQLKEAQVGQLSHTSSSASSICTGARHSGRLSGRLVLAVLFLSAVPAFRPAEAQEEPAAGGAPAAIPLPKGFTPPPKIPPVMEMENELLTKEEDERLEKELRRDRYSSILRSGQVNDRTRSVIEKGARWLVQRLTMKSHRDELSKLRDEAIRDVRTNLPDAPREARELLLTELTKQAGELLEGHNFKVRLNAILLLSQLTLQDPEPGKPNSPTIAWAGAADPLMKVIENPDQLDSLKLPAAIGLENILRQGQPSAPLRDRITSTLVKALADSTSNPWYQQHLARALASSGMLYPRVGEKKPFVVQALAKAMVDRDRHWIVRAEAARSLGRVPLDSSVNDKLLTYEFVNLGHQMAEAYNTSQTAFFWKDAFFSLYLAFKPIDAEERARLSSSGNQLITRLDTSPTLADAYKQLLPLVLHVIRQPQDNRGQKVYLQLPDAQVKSVQKWLADNKQSGAVAEGLEPITSQTVPVTVPRTAGN